MLEEPVLFLNRLYCYPYHRHHSKTHWFFQFLADFLLYIQDQQTAGIAGKIAGISGKIVCKLAQRKMNFSFEDILSQKSTICLTKFGQEMFCPLRKKIKHRWNQHEKANSGTFLRNSGIPRWIFLDASVSTALLQLFYYGAPATFLFSTRLHTWRLSQHTCEACDQPLPAKKTSLCSGRNSNYHTTKQTLS